VSSTCEQAWQAGCGVSRQTQTGLPKQVSAWLASRSSRAVWCDNRRVQVVVRRARPDDQPVITAMVRRARLNPAGLHWEQFVVGERDGRVVGVAQLRRHSDGTKELASLAVEPGAREHGIATQMIDALLADETAAVYALIDRRFVDHFARWGFRQAGPSELPRSVSRIYLIGRAVTTLGSLLRRQRIRIVPLLRPAR
jgi:amino-acid N-acetyltransferase